MVSWTSLLVEDGFSSIQYTVVSALLSASSVSLAYLLYLAVRALVSASVVAFARKNSPYVDELGSAELDSAREDLIDAIVRGGQNILSAATVLAVALWDSVARPVYVARVCVVAGASIIFELYGNAILGGFIQTWNALLGPSIGVARRFFALIAPVLGALSAIYNTVVGILSTMLTSLTDISGECFASYVVPVATGFTQAVGQLAYAIGLTVANLLGTPFDIRAAVRHAQAGLAGITNMLTCTCFIAGPAFIALLGPLQTPQVEWMVGNATLAVTTPFQATGRAIFFAERPDYNPSFYAAQYAILHNADMGNDYINRFGALAVTGQSPTYSQAPTNLGIPNVASGGAQYAPFPDRTFGYRPGFTLVPTTPWFTGVAVSGHFMQAGAFVICGFLEIGRMAVDLLVHLNILWSTTATLEQKKAYFAPDTVEWYFGNGTQAVSNGTLFLLAYTHVPEVTVMPVVWYDYTMLMQGLVFGGYRFVVDVAFGVSDSIVSDSSIVLAATFWRTYELFNKYIIERSLLLASSSSVVLGAPRSAAGSLFYYSAESVVQFVNNTGALVAGSLLYTAPVSTRVALGVPGPSAQQLRTAYQPTFTALALAAEECRPFAVLFPVDSIMNRRCESIGNSGSMFMAPQPGEWWQARKCMATRSCQSGRCPYEMAQAAAARDPATQDLCRRTGCDPLGSFDENAPDQCAACPPGCVYSCQLASVCALSKCYYTQVSINNVICNVDSMGPDIVTGAVGLVQGAVDYIVDSIISSVDEGAVSTTVLWPESTVNEFVCGAGRLAAHAGVGVMSSFAPPLYAALVNGGFSEARAKQTVFFIGEVCTHVTNIPTFMLDTTIQIYKYNYNTVVSVFVGSFAPSQLPNKVAEFTAALAARPFMMWSTPIDNFLAWCQGLLLTFNNLVAVLVDRVQCGYSSAPLSTCPQRIFTDLVGAIGTIRDLIPDIITLIYRLTMLAIRFIIAMLAFNETNWQYLWSDIMELLSTFQYLLLMLVRVLQYFVMETSFAKAVYKLIKEFVCDSLIPWVNSMISGWNGLIDKINDVKLGPIHVIKTFGPWYLFRWMHLDNLKLGTVGTPSGMCDAPASEFGVRPPGYTATVCRPGQGACQSTSTCIDPNTPGNLLKNCGQCAGGSGSCNSFTFTCTCGTQYSAPSACATNDACAAEGALCLALAQVNANPYEVMACSQCRAATIVPLCMNAVGYGQQSVCGCVGSTSPSIQGVAACPALLSPCQQMRTVGTSCLGVRADVPFSAATTADLLITDCSMCIAGDHACAAVGPGGALHCICHLNPSQTQYWVTQRSTSPPSWFSADGGLNSRRLLEHPTVGPESTTSVSLYDLQAAVIGGVHQLEGLNITADTVRRLMPPLPHPGHLTARSGPTECDADVDCFAVWPRPSVCASAGFDDTTTVDHGATLCDRCPAGSPGTPRERTCDAGRCRCGRSYRWGLGSIVVANRTTATALFERALALAPPGPCGATLRTVARVFAARGVAPGDAFHEPLETWSPEMGGALNCMEDAFMARSLEGWIGLSGLDAPLLSIDNMLYAGAQTMGVAVALWDWYGATHPHSLLAPPPQALQAHALALQNVTSVPDDALESAHFHALMSAHGVDPLFGIAVAHKIQEAALAAVTYLNPATLLKAVEAAARDTADDARRHHDAQGPTKARVRAEQGDILANIHSIARGVNKLWTSTVGSTDFRAGAMDFVRNLYASRDAQTLASSAAFVWSRARLGERLNPRVDNAATRNPPPIHAHAEAVMRNVRNVSSRPTGETPEWAFAMLVAEHARRAGGPSGERHHAADVASSSRRALLAAPSGRDLLSIPSNVTYPTLQECGIINAVRDAFVDNSVWLWTFFAYQNPLSVERDVAYVSAPVGTTPDRVTDPPLRAAEVKDLVVPAYPTVAPVTVMQTWSTQARAGQHGWWGSATEWILNAIIPLDKVVDDVMQPFYGLGNLEATITRLISCPNIRLTTCADSRDLGSVLPSLLLAQVFITLAAVTLFHLPGAVVAGAMWAATPLTVLSYTYNVSPLCALTLRVSPCLYTDALDASALILPDHISDTSTLARIVTSNQTIVQQCSGAPWNFTGILDNAGYATVVSVDTHCTL